MATYTYPNLPATNLANGDKVIFEYTGQIVNWNPSTKGVTRMRVECYGGSGLSIGTVSKGGKGGCVTGEILNPGELFICVGQGGREHSEAFGGGGRNGGGGATWIARTQTPAAPDHLYCVAGGGGGASTDLTVNEYGGDGGGLVGGNGYASILLGGTQSGINNMREYDRDDGASFLKGGMGIDIGEFGGGGGSGLYGGRGAYADSSYTNTAVGGGGGSSYIGGLNNAITYNGSTPKGNKNPNGKIIITVIDPNRTYQTVNILNKQPFYTGPTTLNVNFGIQDNAITGINIELNGRIIQSITQLDKNSTYQIDLNAENFMLMGNGPNFFKFIFTNATGGALYETIEDIHKFVDKMTIISEPIEVNGAEIALDLNLAFIWIMDPDKVSISACNNAYDDDKHWEDITGPVLSDNNVVLSNTHKNPDNKWGLSIKVEVSCPFEMNEDIIGGFFVHGDKSTQTSSVAGVYTNTPWGSNLHKEKAMETEKEILLMTIRGVESYKISGKDIEHYKSLRDRGFINDSQFERIKKLFK